MSQEMNEREWIERLQRGELRALEVLYQRYKDQVYRVALAITRDDKLAEDILQECFLRLYRSARLLDPQRPLVPWLYRMTVNLTYDNLDRERHTLKAGDLTEWFSTLAGSFPGPEVSAEHTEQARWVREAIRALPHTHRSVVVLFYLENLSIEDIAGILNLPAGTVKSRLYTARQTLREVLMQQQRLLPQVAYEYT